MNGPRTFDLHPEIVLVILTLEYTPAESPAKPVIVPVPSLLTVVEPATPSNR